MKMAIVRLPKGQKTPVNKLRRSCCIEYDDSTNTQHTKKVVLMTEPVRVVIYVVLHTLCTSEYISISHTLGT